MKLPVLGMALLLGLGAAAPVRAAAASAGIDDVKSKTVCFAAHNGSDPVAVPVTGTLFYQGHYTASTPVVLAVHGFGADRSVWDGWFFGARNAGSFARDLAASGYVVITYDQIGYGQSPYVRPPGSGFSITMDNELGALHEVVTQVRNGSYRVSPGSCPSGTRAAFGSSDVVLAGHSAAALLVEAYAGKFHDIKALIPIAATTNGNDADLDEDVIGPWVIPQLQSGNDYPTFMPPNPNGLVSTDCLEFFFYLPAGHRALLDAACANRRLETVPGGQFATVTPFVGEAHTAIQSIGDIPVLLVFADHDRIFVGPKEAVNGRADHQTPEIQYFRKSCGCDLSVYTQQNSGHYLQLQGTVHQTTDFIDDWLDREL